VIAVSLATGELGNHGQGKTTAHGDLRVRGDTGQVLFQDGLGGFVVQQIAEFGFDREAHCNVSQQDEGGR
jgi:hypothetical protein